MTRLPKSVIAFIALGVVDLASTLVRRLHDQQQGQVLVLVAGLLSVFGGMTAVAVDLGSYMAHRADQQNSADAIALAASQELPDEGAVLSVASQWAVKNDIDPSDINVEIIPQSDSELNPKVRVEVQGEHGFTFARLIGINSATVSTTAAAIKSSPSGGDNVVPLAVTEAALVGVTVNDQVVLRYDSNDITNGNTGPIVIDNTGTGNCQDSASYCDGLKEGSESVVCAVGEDPTYCDGPSTVNTFPGNVVGGTREAITYRLDNTSAQCDEFYEVFEDDPLTAEADIFRIVNECNPYLEGGYDSMRVLIIPIIDELCTGSCPVTITGFALFFLEGFGNGQCTGSDCEIIGRFVQVNQNVGLLAGTFDPNAFDHSTRLVE